MTDVSTSSYVTGSTEFILEKDPFENARRKGSVRWILAHIFHGSNKFVVLFTFLGTILSSVIASSMMILIGKAIDEFAKEDTSNLQFYVILILFLGLLSPILDLTNCLTFDH